MRDYTVSVETAPVDADVDERVLGGVLDRLLDELQERRIADVASLDSRRIGSTFTVAAPSTEAAAGKAAAAFTDALVRAFALERLDTVAPPVVSLHVDLLDRAAAA